MKKILLTGPSGFIGTHILLRLLAEECEIHAINRKGYGGPNKRIVWHAADLRDPVQAAAIVARVGPTHLLHNAWVATPRAYSYSPENLDWLRSTLAIASAFGKNGGIHFVGVGSSAEYDPGDGPCIEDLTPIRPATIYGKCKAASHLALQATAEHYGFSSAWGRVFLPYGPGDPLQRLVPTISASLLAGKAVETTHGRQLRDFIYAPEVADLLVRLLFSHEAGAFNIGTGRAVTIRSVIENISLRCGRPDLVRFGAIDPPAGEPPVLVADMSKVRDRLGWSAPTTLELGLDRYFSSALMT